MGIAPLIRLHWEPKGTGCLHRSLLRHHSDEQADEKPSAVIHPCDCRVKCAVQVLQVTQVTTSHINMVGFSPDVLPRCSASLQLCKECITPLWQHPEEMWGSRLSVPSITQTVAHPQQPVVQLEPAGSRQARHLVQILVSD